jgi:hypothetical protein
MGRDSGEIMRLFNPRRDQWIEHFRWEGATLVGLSPMGVVTIDVLKINDPSYVAVREGLIAEGEFPG